MLERSAESYVFLYRPSGVAIVPAVAVVAAGGDPRDLASWSLAEFFTAHFSSFIGDPALSDPGDDAIQGLIEGAPARGVLFMGAGPEGEDPWAQFG
jgi:hypothetical protein